MTVPTPKVFISYSWTDNPHVDWVESFAKRLTGDGVEVKLDQWDLKPGQDKYAFMEQMVTDAEVKKVLVICDRRYADRANKRKGGVGTEAQLISKEVYEKVDQDKFIPIIRERDDSGNEYIPAFFASRIFIDLSNEERYEDEYVRLLRIIFERPERTRPQLGKPPAFLFAENVVHVRTEAKLAALKAAVLGGKPIIKGLLQDYLDTFSEALADFRLNFDQDDGVSNEQRVLDSIARCAPYRDNFVDFVLLVADYHHDEDTLDRIHGFLEGLVPYLHRPASTNRWADAWADNFVFIVYELFLYLVAALIKRKQYAIAARFIEAEYGYEYGFGSGRHHQGGAGAFCGYSRTLDNRDRYHGHQPVKTTGMLLAERATHPKVHLADVSQADFLLWMRPHFPDRGSCSFWYPKCTSFARQAETLPLFARVTSKDGIKPFKHLLRVNTVQELYSTLAEMVKKPEVQQATQEFMWYFRLQLNELLNINQIEYYLGIRK